MKKRLKTQLQNSEEIRDVLRKVPVRFNLPGGERVETLLIYLPCKDGRCDYSDLFRVIKESIMINFVFSCSEIKEKLSIKNGKAPQELFKKAIRKLSKHTAKGELGELLLFTLLDVYFEAPKILSKISLKTSKRVPVFGADAVHAQYVNETLRLYLGESKLHKTFGNAASSAVKSISNCVQKYSEEFDLIDTHISFPEMSRQARDELINILNPFSENKKNVPNILHAPCFIGFVEPTVFCDDEENYKRQYIKVAKHHVGAFYAKMKSEQNDISKTALLLLPFASLGDLVKGFVRYMGIEE